MPRPNENEGARKKSTKKPPPEYDVCQLDLQWFPKLQPLCQITDETTRQRDDNICNNAEKDQTDFSATTFGSHQPLTSKLSTKDRIRGRGEINVRQLKDTLKEMDRKDLGKF